MTLSAGNRLGPYEIHSALGAGGMGEVYRARDTKLGRDVALKILPDIFATDPERLARLQREAQVLASLNHPHIGAIYGFEESNGVRALVLELVEGPTLADRIAQGAIPLDEALPIARQIAEALEAAHEQRVIHRDLKPANIKLRPDGVVKVLDFGLAKLAEAPAAVGADGRSQSPTITTPAMMTGVGMILGTAVYMSPEQAKGRPADKRSDVWALGCVLYEMLTGKRAFEGEDVSDTIAAVLRGEPDWSALPSALPMSSRALIEGCLKKDRHQRIGDVSTASFLLTRPEMAPLGTEAVAARRPLWKRAIPVAAAAAIGALVMGVALRNDRPAGLVPVTRFHVSLPDVSFAGVPPGQPLGFSGDGTSIAVGRQTALFVHSLVDNQSRLILNTDNIFPNTPIFSPDGRWIAFFAGSLDGTGRNGALKKVAVTGGAAITLCQTGPPFGASWPDTRILFASPVRGILSVSENGGTPETLVAPNRDEVLLGPQLLPDGDALLFTVAHTGAREPGIGTSGISQGLVQWDRADIVVQSLRTGQRKTLVHGGADGRYVPSGHIVYAIGGVLFAVPFNRRRLEVTGGPVPVVEGVRRTSIGSALYAVSNTGSLVYVSGPARSGFTASTDLAWTTTNGAVERLAVPPGAYETPRIAPDGRRAAIGNTDASGPNIWIVDLSGASSMRRLTFGGRNRHPEWSPDSARVAFQTDREGDLGIFWQRLDGTGIAERLTKAGPGVVHAPESWAPDGKHLLFSETKGDDVTLWTLSLPDRKAEPLDGVRSTKLTNAVFSPDGRWVAYNSDESGADTVYVQPFPVTGAKYQVSRSDIGHHPLWSRDGKHLFYIPGPGRFLGVTVNTQAGFAFSAPMPAPRGFAVGNGPTDPRNHDIAPDGRVLGVVPTGGPTPGSTSPQQAEVVLNWLEELKKRVPTR